VLFFGVILLFFGVLFHCPPTPFEKRVDNAFFVFFWYFSVFFFVNSRPHPPENFSADAFESKKYAPTYPTLLRLF